MCHAYLSGVVCSVGDGRDFLGSGGVVGGVVNVVFRKLLAWHGRCSI